MTHPAKMEASAFLLGTAPVLVDGEDTDVKKVCKYWGLAG